MECLKECPDETAEVCGTNDNTYKNICHLEKAHCQFTLFDYKVEKAHDGPCLSRKLFLTSLNIAVG